MPRRNIRLLAPLVGAVVAAIVVAAVSLASEPTGRKSGGPRSTAAAAQPQVRPTAGALDLQNAVVAVVRALSPSVVQIQTPQGLGSGIVFDARGDIVTNNHVVSGASSFTVTTSGGKRYPAKLVGAFPPDDLAVIRVSGAKLRPAQFADSSKLEVGDIAIAIGNPLGLRSSVTDGIVSAFRQGISEGGGVALPSMIQTSAAINPGNSGGALADVEGRVIGIPTLAATDPELGGSAPGIGFAIPSDTVTDIAGQLVRYGRVVDSHRAYLGIRGGDTNGAGVYVGLVESGGPAARAGLKPGDVLVSVAGIRTPTLDALTSVLARLRPGQAVALAIVRQNGSRATLHVTLGTYPGGR